MEIKPVFVTARSIMFEVIEDANYFTEEYEILVNDIVVSKSDRVIETIYDLKPDTTYMVQIRRGMFISNSMQIHTKYEFVTLNVRDFGAKGDGITDDTASIQATIMCCPKDGRVYINNGIYKFTNLFLKSNLILEIDKDATLSAFTDKSHIPILPGRVESYDEEKEYLIGSWEGNPLTSFASLITGISVENVVICGRGTIDGCADFQNWWDKEKRKHDPARPRMVFLNHCRNVTLQGLTIMNSPAWNLHPYFSENLKFLGLSIFSPSKSHNTDGLDPESCRNVDIIGVHFSVGDDCIAIKSGKIYMGKTYKTPSSNIMIRQCFMENGHGAITVGSEIAAGVKEITATDCLFINTDRGLRIKTRRGRGKDSVLDEITFKRIKMDQVRTPFVINSFYYCDPDGKTDYVATKEALPIDERTPEIRRIHIQDVLCDHVHVAACYFYGLPEKKIEEITMENVRFNYAEDAKPGTAAMMKGCDPTSKMGIFIRNASRVILKNVILNGNEGKNIDIAGVEDVEY